MEQAISTQQIKAALQSQHLATLDMMSKAIEVCSDDLWLSADFINPVWRLVYHDLYYFHLYLHQSVADHTPWRQHLEGAENLSLDPDSTDVAPYTKEQMMDFLQHCKASVAPMIAKMDIVTSDCGFPWYKISKLEHQITNIRHFQQHVGQLQDRIRNVQGEGISWTRNQ